MKSKFTEKDLVEIANRATVNAVSETLKNGGSITFQRGKKIFREEADGKIIFVRNNEKAYVRVKRKRLKPKQWHSQR